MSNETKVDQEQMSAEELYEGLTRSVVTSIESHGELVYEPGMSDEERAVRSRDVMWRHGGEERVRESAKLNVEEGLWNQEQADAHVRRFEDQARRDRARVVEFDAARPRSASGGGDRR